MGGSSPRRDGCGSAIRRRRRLRLDALVRLLQDVSDDGTRSAGFEDAAGWWSAEPPCTSSRSPRTSRCCTPVPGAPAPAGSGSRISVNGEKGGSIESATLWVHLDPSTMRPLVLPPRFHELFGEAAGGRTVRASLHHGPRPEDLPATRHFPLRFTDFDVLGHVNNANYWVPVEEELARRREVRAPLRAEVELGRHRAGRVVDVHVRDGDGMFDLWLVERDPLRVCHGEGGGALVNRDSMAVDLPVTPDDIERAASGSPVVCGERR